MPVKYWTHAHLSRPFRIDRERVVTVARLEPRALAGCCNAFTAPFTGYPGRTD